MYFILLKRISLRPLSLCGESDVTGTQEPVGFRIDLLRWRESEPWFLDISLHSITMRLDIVKPCASSHTMLATITESDRLLE